MIYSQIDQIGMIKLASLLQVTRNQSVTNPTSSRKTTRDIRDRDRVSFSLYFERFATQVRISVEA